MFGIIGDVFDSACDTVSDFVEGPIETSARIATQPVRDGLEIIDGLTEGEIRTDAALRFGADVVGGMAFSEILDLYS